MDVNVIQSGQRLILDPACEPELLRLAAPHRHAVHHQLCQRVYAHLQGAPPGPPTALRDRGFTTVPGCLDTGAAAAFSGAMTAALEAEGKIADPGSATPRAPVGAKVVAPCHGDFLDAAAATFPAIFNATMTAELESYFGSYFRIDTGVMFRTYPADRHIVSFLWHRDVAPMAQVHIMVYLTDSGPDARGTSFIDLADSAEAARLGYHYPAIDERAGDLEQALAGSGMTPKIETPIIKAGDALVFSSARALHRGCMPKNVFRDVMLLVVLPSMAPWSLDIEEFGVAEIFADEHKDTLHSNPFRPQFPPVEGEAGNVSVVMPPWAIDGHLHPSDGE